MSTLLFVKFPPVPSVRFPHSNSLHNIPKFSLFNCKNPHYNYNLNHTKMLSIQRANAVPSVQGAVSGAMNLMQSAPPTWQSALLSNIVIFVLGSPILLSGLIVRDPRVSERFHAFFLKGLLKRGKEGRGPGSVIGSSAAGCVCAFLSIYGVGGKAFYRLWQLGFVSSFCTKLSDTVSSEIGKAYGKTTYLVTTFKVVPRGTEGAVSVEGTVAGLLASIILASVGCYMGQINAPEAVVCVIASQIANLGESIIGAAFQEKEGFRWLNNDAVNVINISNGQHFSGTDSAILFSKTGVHDFMQSLGSMCHTTVPVQC
ncbi:hypothetical protein Patl1_04941 [Pistacia atlantica]|uniref:Uncharacterized protein n=1 Tax=Pistacia atlantica TaxID=434234 RepID=A0ACC1BTT6_9ROSI|nr:hypothetical protein Patl1_04941 [Pistacia atlantica]